MNNYPNKSINIAIHIVVWCGIFSMPYIVTYFARMDLPPIGVGAFVMPLQVMMLFYLNYLWLINKFLFKKRVWAFLGINLLITILVSAIMVYVRHALLPAPEHLHVRPGFDQRSMIGLPIVMSSLTQMLVVGLSVAIKMTGKWYEARQQMQELEKINTQVELQQLKSQLNPHFLFNSLNNIYALITFDPDKAQLSLHNLCDMLRYQLYESNRETIPLEKEVEFVGNYCDLMRLLLPKHVALEVELPSHTQHTMIAPLLFVSIIENAFKHGVSQSKPSYISIKIAVEPQHIHCIAKNSYHPKTDNDRSGSGIGIENLRRRLELLYPNTHSFSAQKVGDEFIAQLTIQTTR